MLDLIRKKQKSVIVKVVFWTIIAAFVGTIFLVWGKGRDDSGGDPSAAITVNNTKVSYNDYQATYSSLYRLYQNIYRDQFTPAVEKQLNLDRQALDMVIDQTLLLEEADRLGLEVSKGELVESIAKIPAFQNNGVFDKNTYIEVLNYQRLTPDTFEAMQKRDLLIQKVRTTLTESVTVTEEDIVQEYRNRNEKVNLSFIQLAAPLFESKVEVKEDELKAFFDENREQYRIPERVALNFLLFNPAQYEDEQTLTEKEIEKYYRRHLGKFEIPEQVKASHILIKVSQDADEDLVSKKKALAEKALEEAKSGKDFALLARTYSDDTGSASEGGDLGYFTRGTMVDAFEQAAFALQPGEMSEIVRTPFGFHIIKVEGYIEEGVKPLADVLAEIKSELRVEKARQHAMDLAMKAYSSYRESGDLEAAAKDNALEVKETDLFTREEPADGIGDSAEVRAAAFALTEGTLARPVSLPEGILLFGLKERKDSRLPELDEVRPAVEDAFRQSRSMDLARAEGEAMLKELQEGQSLARLAQKYDQEVGETGLFARSFGSFIPRLGNSQQLSEAAFTLTEEAPAAPELYTIGGKLVLAELKELQPADTAALTDDVRDELRKALQTQKEEQVLSDKVETLRKTATITIAPQLKSAIDSEE